MATKKASAARQLETYKKQYKKECRSLRWFYLAAAAVAVVTLLLFLVRFMYIYNIGTDSNGDIYGLEISVSGWSLFLATISGQFDSPSQVFGDLYLFFYHDGGYTAALGAFTLLAVICALASIVLNVIALLGKNKLTYVAAGLDIATSVMILGAMIVALAANGSNILVGYCSSNPNCSIRTQSFIPLICSLGSVAAGIAAAIKYSRAGKLLRKIKSKERAIEKAKAKEAAEKAEKAAN